MVCNQQGKIVIMYASRNLTPDIILRIAWKPLVFFIFYYTLLTAIFVFANAHFFVIPFVPVSLVGTAVAFYVGFKNNSSYERLWEARKIWGAIVNISRTFSVFVLDFIKETEEMDYDNISHHKRIIIHRHISYINALRVQLRTRTVWDHKNDPMIDIVKEETPFYNDNLLNEIKQFLHEDEANYLYNKNNTATHILRKQSEHINFLFKNGCLDVFKQVELSRVIAQLYDQQGACERIKGYPFPRQYAFFSELFVWIFSLLLPFGLLGELRSIGTNFVWFTIPLATLICWIFFIMEVVGDKSENPFENGINDIPMTAICRTIEIDLREMLGEKDLPGKIFAINNIIM